MKVFYLVVILFMVAVMLVHFFPQINFRPMPDGLCQAQLNKDKPNWVSSLVDKKDPHYVKPLNFKTMDMEKLAQCLDEGFDGVTVVNKGPSEIIAHRHSRVFNFVDWICIKANGDVTSSATMGYSDLGKNRELVEEIRAVCSF